MDQRARTPARRHARGLGLIDSVVVTAVSAVVVGLSTPSMLGAVERRRVLGLADQFENDVHYARSEAQVRGQPVRLTFPDREASPAGHCWIVHTGPADDCTCSSDGTAACGAGGVVLRAVLVPSADGATVASNTRSMAFDARRQTVTPAASVNFSGARGTHVRQVVNVLGRVRSCAPGASLPGLRSC